jgi:3-oxoacyl-[acyl-carrier protein] reductase
MADRYQKWTNGRTGGFVATRLGLPRPEPLRRHRDGGPALPGPVVIGGAGGDSGAPGAPGAAGTEPRGRLLKILTALLEGPGFEVIQPDAAPPEGHASYGALVFDATVITQSSQLAELYDFFHSRIRSLAPCGRVLILSSPPDSAYASGSGSKSESGSGSGSGPESASSAGGTVAIAVAQRAIEGFMRSVGKELRRGATANLVQVEIGAEHSIESAVRFILSPRSAYVSGQVLRIGAGSKLSPDAAVPTADAAPLAGTTSVVTGAARGIGAEIARILARDGAFVYCLDVPAQGAALRQLAEGIGGQSVELDISGAGAAEQLADSLKRGSRPGSAGVDVAGVDVFVHNAGILRDKTLGRMERGQWDAVLGVNLIAVETLTRRLLDPVDPLLRPGGRIICTSSISAIAGNLGQTNYAAGKAGLIGLVSALASTVSGQLGGTINAVAPGFIETQMTASVPLFIREAGRRMNSLKQGGLPVDVAEAVAFLAAPGSSGINGQVLRVCGQALLGA